MLSFHFYISYISTNVWEIYFWLLVSAFCFFCFLIYFLEIVRTIQCDIQTIIQTLLLTQTCHHYQSWNGSWHFICIYQQQKATIAQQPKEKKNIGKTWGLSQDQRQVRMETGSRQLHRVPVTGNTRSLALALLWLELIKSFFLASSHSRFNFPRRKCPIGQVALDSTGGEKKDLEGGAYKDVLDSLVSNQVHGLTFTLLSQDEGEGIPQWESGCT